MPIIAKVGRKSLRIRLLIALMHTVLVMGAVTMVYPFLLMLGTSLTSSTDTNEFRVVPRYLYDEKALFAKYADDKYWGELDTINRIYHTGFLRLQDVAPPKDILSESVKRRVTEWQEFKKTLPPSFLQAGFRGYGQHPSRLNLSYIATMRTLFNNDIHALGKAYDEDHEAFDTVLPPRERPESRNWSPDTSRKTAEFLAWKKNLPDDWLIVTGAETLFAKYLQEDAAYGGDLRKAVSVWGEHRTFDEIPLPVTPPANPAQRADWETFVRTKLPFRYLALPSEAATPYRAFLRQRYPTIDKLNRSYGEHFADFNAIPLPAVIPDGGPLVQDWGEFIAKAIPAEMLHLDTPEKRYRDFLAKMQGDTSETKGTVSEAFPPYYLADALYVHENASALRRDFAGRNYRLVVDYLLLHGRALWVTVIFCLAVILTTLTVNPLCAYALSRFHLPYAYNVLLFLLATMAFPAEVAMIPNFLLLKELGMLNTYWALILPGAASGFSIFLLKGFFDSLPKELYEAGMIDGASETRMFWQITLPLARPIFAVIALEAFAAAYGAFMFALIVCQDTRMWTLMVWLYQLQINNPSYVMMAALTVASLPTLLIFVFAQNVILRGIILPIEK